MGRRGRSGTMGAVQRPPSPPDSITSDTHNNKQQLTLDHADDDNAEAQAQAAKLAAKHAAHFVNSAPLSQTSSTSSEAIEEHQTQMETEAEMEMEQHHLDQDHPPPRVSSTSINHHQLLSHATPPHPSPQSSIPSLSPLQRSSPAISKINTQNFKRQSLGYNNSPSSLKHSQAHQSLSLSATPTNNNLQQRHTKRWLVLVVPPLVLPHSPPPSQVSGFANGYGASGRFSGGILLPLQSTLAAQLSLIAREFSLPSIGGVSLYFCLPTSSNDDVLAMGMKPRLMEETWSVLWQSHFDPEESSHAEGIKGVNGLPIAGRLEFDIDPRKARWLAAWTQGTAANPLAHQGLASMHDRTMSLDTHQSSFSLDERDEDRSDPRYQHGAPRSPLALRTIPTSNSTSPSPSNVQYGSSPQQSIRPFSLLSRNILHNNAAIASAAFGAGIVVAPAPIDEPRSSHGTSSSNSTASPPPPPLDPASLRSRLPSIDSSSYDDDEEEGEEEEEEEDDDFERSSSTNATAVNSVLLASSHDDVDATSWPSTPPSPEKVPDEMTEKAVPSQSRSVEVAPTQELVHHLPPSSSNVEAAPLPAKGDEDELDMRAVDKAIGMGMSLGAVGIVGAAAGAGVSVVSAAAKEAAVLHSEKRVVQTLDVERDASVDATLVRPRGLERMASVHATVVGTEERGVFSRAAAEDREARERNGSSATLVDRDWEVKVRPLRDISGTPTPGFGFGYQPERKEVEAGGMEGEKTFQVAQEKAVETASKESAGVLPPHPGWSWSDVGRHSYPHFDLYPSIYPNFNLYTPLAPTSTRPSPPPVESQPKSIDTAPPPIAAMAATVGLASIPEAIAAPSLPNTPPRSRPTSQETTFEVEGLGMGSTKLGWIADGPGRQAPAVTVRGRSPKPPVGRGDQVFAATAVVGAGMVVGLGMGSSRIAWMDSPDSSRGGSPKQAELAGAKEEVPETVEVVEVTPEKLEEKVQPSRAATKEREMATFVEPGSTENPWLLSHSTRTYPWNLAEVYPSTQFLQRLYPVLAPSFPPRWSYNLSTSLAPSYPFLQLYKPKYPTLDIYPQLPVVSVTPPTATTPKRSIPVPLILHQAPSSLISPSWPSSAASPERLESAALDERLAVSAAYDEDGVPALQFPDYGTRGVTQSTSFEHQQMSAFVESDREITMVSLADASLPSPTIGVDSDHTGEVHTAIFDSDAESDHGQDDQHEDSLIAPSSPVHNYSTLFLPPPTSEGFSFPEPSPTINASQINSQYAAYSTPMGHPDPDPFPFMLSPGLGAALGFDEEDQRSPSVTDMFLDDTTGEYDEQGREVHEEDGPGVYDALEDDDVHGAQYILASPAATSEVASGSPQDSHSPAPDDEVPAPVLFSFPPSGDDLAAAVAQYIIEAQTQSIQRRGRFAVALAGGSLVKIIEEGLLHDDRVCWDKWEVFFTDERLVPLDSPDSTFKAYDDALFSKVPIPAWQIHSIKSLPDIDNRPVPVTAAEEIASDYETSLLASFPDVNGPGLVPGPPRFDLILLGMGPDGHVASLFPGHQLLEEKDWWISYLTNSPKSPTARITFTLPLLCAARRLAFVCTGASKADALANALDSTVPVESKVPAGRVCLSGHPVVFFVDEDCRRDLEYPRSLFWD